MILNRKQLGRIREIGAVLIKHGWGHIITKAGLGGLFRYRGDGATSPEPPVRLIEAIQELGPTYIKFGQIMSTRPDLLPREYIVELSKLQDTANTIPVDQVREVIQEELGDPVEKLFESFEDRPIAAASLGQVHGAVLHDGTRVIVKVQRPGIRNIIDRDLEILYVLARFLEARSDRARTYGLVDIVDDFALTIREELDYSREGHNTQHLNDVLANLPQAQVPRIYWEFSGNRVLTMERIDGVKVTDIDALQSIGAEPNKVAADLAAIFLEQIFVDGFFHADPHPGNLLVTADHRIALIDAGQVRQLDAVSRAGLIRLLIAFEHQDSRRFAEEVRSLGIARGEIDFPLFSRDIEKILRQFYDLPSSVVSIGQLLARVMDVSARHRVRLPTEFAVLGKVLANVDGINRQLDPTWNFTETARAYIARSVREQLSLDELLTDTYRAIMDGKEFLFNLPEYMSQLIRKAIEGSLRIEFKHKGLEDLESRLERSVNRLAFALIVVGITIASSLILLAQQGPTGLWGLPVIGIAGYVVAAVFGVWLLVSIMRSGHL